jgi:GNAT superfamily N-acetyltransferase
MISFELARAAAPLRHGFTAAGWRTHSLVWMHHEGPRPAPADTSVSEVPYDSVSHLREAWHREDFPGQDASGFHAHLREVQLARGDRVLAIHEHGEPVGYATLGSGPGQTEVEAVYVLPAHRGQGRGTALTQAAIAAAPDSEDLWICADADDWPQHLYARLGFRPVLHTMEFLRLP